jgi:NTE family protein
MDFGSVLAETSLFAAVGEAALDELSSRAERQDLRSGECLYSEGEPPTWFYLVVSGRLRVSSQGALVGYVGRSEPVGEMGVLTGEPRTATVRAVRDSIVLRIANSDFLEFLARHSPALMALSRLAIERLRQHGRTRMLSATEVQGTLAVIPASPDVPVTALAEALVRRLSGWPDARLITAGHVDAALAPDAAQTPLSDDEASTRLMGWLNELEGRHRYVIYAADSDRDNWALRCLHNADRVLALAEAGMRPTPVPVLSELRKGGAPVELVLLRPEGDPSPHTLAWREETGARAHYFVHPWGDSDLASLARQLTGRGVGLVLGGGGARGFAHIGLVRALERLGIPVDVMGGTSMGAFISALLACGFDSVEMAEIARESFVRNNYLNDYAVPRVSLIRGRKFAARLRDLFGERQIEELRRTYFCVSTSLTTGATVVHDRGPLSVWVGTSMAVPGVAPPIAYEEELLCDGGVVDNLPTDVMQKLERGSIIACNVSTEGAIRAPGAGLGEPDPEALLRRRGEVAPPRLSEILVRSATLTSATAMHLAAERADVYVRMPTQDVGMFDWRRLDELIERGYEHALERLAPLRDTLIRDEASGRTPAAH